MSRDSPIEARYAALKGLRLGVTSPGVVSDLSADGCFDAAAVRSTLTVRHEVEITDTAGDPAEGVSWTNAYNQC